MYFLSPLPFTVLSIVWLVIAVTVSLLLKYFCIQDVLQYNICHYWNFTTISDKVVIAFLATIDINPRITRSIVKSKMQLCDGYSSAIPCCALQYTASTLSSALQACIENRDYLRWLEFFWQPVVYIPLHCSENSMLCYPLQLYTLLNWCKSNIVDVWTWVSIAIKWCSPKRPSQRDH